MPEKTTPEIPREVRDLYEKGNAAVQRENWDYALLFFNQALQKEPGFFECRQALRAAQMTKASRNTSFFKKVLGTAGSSPLIAKGQLALRKDPLEAILVAEQILNSDPNNSSAHNLLAQAALAVDLPRTAVFSLEQNRKNSPTDRNTALSLATAYIAAKTPARAEAIYQDLLRQDRNDTEVANLLKNLSANRTMSEGGYEGLAEGKGSFRDILKDKDQAATLEQEAKQVRSLEATLKLIDEAHDKLREDPSNLQQAKQLADLYVQAKDYTKALKYYQQLSQIEGFGDAAMEKTIAELTIKKADADLAALDPGAPDFAQRKEELDRFKAEFQLEDIKRRVEKYSNDLLIRYDYGVQLYKLGRYAEAIQEFQKSQNNASRKVQSLAYLGRCFMARNMNDLALKFLLNAIKDKPTFDEERKDLVYLVGDLLEKMGQREQAIEQYKQIFEVDIGYRDVAAKVEAYYAAKGG